MRSETENQYLLKAVDAFKRRLIVISPEFKILAVNDGLEGTDDVKGCRTSLPPGLLQPPRTLPQLCSPKIQRNRPPGLKAKTGRIYRPRDYALSLCLSDLY